MYVDVLVDMCADMYVNLCVHMCIDMCIDIGICMDIELQNDDLANHPVSTIIVLIMQNHMSIHMSHSYTRVTAIPGVRARVYTYMHMHVHRHVDHGPILQCGCGRQSPVFCNALACEYPCA